MKINPAVLHKFSRVLIFAISIASTISASSQDDPKKILEQCFLKCLDLTGGRYTAEISEKSYNDSVPALSTAACRFLRVEGDSASPFKFFVSMNSGNAALCTSNDLVVLSGRDSTGVIYSRSSNQSMFRGALQAEGLFPPFFQPNVVFSLDRMEQTTFIVRQGKDETVNGSACYNIKLIDLIRASLPDGQKQEKTFLIDKKTLLPVFYSEKSVMKIGADSASKENTFRLTDFSPVAPHDSLFTYKSIPFHFELRNILEHVYHHHLKKGAAAPDFRGKLIDGDSVSLNTFAGKKILLFFFYRASYPSLKALNAVQEYQNANPGHEVLLIGIDASEHDLKALLKKRNITVKAIEDGHPVADEYFINSAPSFIYLDENRVIQKIHSGFGGKTVIGF